MYTPSFFTWLLGVMTSPSISITIFGGTCDHNCLLPIIIHWVLFELNIRHLLKKKFSYEKSHSTELCVWTIKHRTDYYTRRGSPVNLYFLDVNKAFNRVNYWKLFTKMHVKGAPARLVNLLVFWYTEQEFRGSWGSTLSHSFAANNGSDSSILSPHLFNIYMNGLSHALAVSGTGCYFHDKCFKDVSTFERQKSTVFVLAY